MEISGVIHEVGRVGDETETEETLCERKFTVGEVVEYWEGTYVRGGASWVRGACFCEESGRKWSICN